MNNKDFHIIVKDIVSKHGDSIIEKPQFPNLLADLGAYKDLPALKQIVNTLLKSGFGAFLYNLTQNKENNILEKCYEHRMEFISEGKFREDLTEYTYSRFSFSLPMCRSIQMYINIYNSRNSFWQFIPLIIQPVWTFIKGQ